MTENLATPIARISTTATGVQGADQSFGPVFSPDGTRIAFGSVASNLGAGDLNGSWDIFVKNLETGALAHISTAANGEVANGLSTRLQFSPDGLKVVFYSEATNLVAGDDNGFGDIFVKDLVTGAVTRVNTSSIGAEANDQTNNFFFTPDGTSIIFSSFADNLVEGDTNGALDIFVKSLPSGATGLLSATFAQQANGESSAWYTVGNGRKLVFSSAATNLYIGDINGDVDVFTRDLVTGAVTRINATAAGDPLTNGTTDTLQLVVSEDGSKMLFRSELDSLIAGDTNLQTDVFVKNTVNGTITRVSTSASGQEADGSSGNARFSPDGTMVLFTSGATNLVPGDTNGTTDLFLKNLATGAIQRINATSAGGQSSGGVLSFSFSPDGARVLFESSATDLVTSDTNGQIDLFLKNVTTGTLQRINTSAAGSEAVVQDTVAFQIVGTGDSGVFSPGGDRIAFKSLANNLVPGDGNQTFDIFVKDLAVGPPPPTVSISNASATEGGLLNFTVSLSNAAAADITVSVQLDPVTATAGTDYSALAGTVVDIVIPAGETSATMSIATAGDAAPELAETMTATITAAPGTTIGDGSGTGTITDNDLKSTAALFAENGKLVTLATLARAAYSLNDLEVPEAGYNDPSPSSDAAFDGLATQLQMLTAADLPSLVPVDDPAPHFNMKGLTNGIYTNENAAALVARSTDALFVSFRGTNDFSFNGFVPFLDASPDISHWTDKGEHYDLFADFVTALHTYVAAHTDLSVIYVTGHSLGGGMVQPFINEAAAWGRTIDATTFASPGFTDPLVPFNLPETTVSNIWNNNDPILSAVWVSEIHGDENTIENGLGIDNDHSMDLYLEEIDFLHQELPSLTSRDLFLDGVDYDRILLTAYEVAGQYSIGGVDETLAGGTSNDIVLGGAGNDTLSGGAGSDRIMGGAGNDTLLLDTNENALPGTLRNDIYDGGAGIDTLDLSSLSGGSVTDLTAGTAQGASVGNDLVFNVEHVKGTSGTDRVSGTSGSNRLVGNGGADTLIGLGGNDILEGGTGDDRLEGGTGNDVYIFEEDIDTISDAGGTSDVLRLDQTKAQVGRTYSANLGGDLIIDIDWSFSIDFEERIIIEDFYTGQGIETLRFTDGDIVLAADIRSISYTTTPGYFYSTIYNETFTGTVGMFDTVNYATFAGGAIIDLDIGSGVSRKLSGPAALSKTLPGGEVRGTATGAFGTDTLINVDDIVGTTGSDIIAGSRYGNDIDGAAGDDRITGDRGQDLLTGGLGADDFDFNFITETGKRAATRDVIRDFEHGIDDIDMKTIDAKTGGGNQKFKFIGREAFHDVKGELRFTKINKAGTANDKTIVEGDVNGDGKADFQIELTGLVGLTKGDFIL